MDERGKLRNLWLILASHLRGTFFMAENHRDRWWLWSLVVTVVIIGLGVWYFRRGHEDAPQYETVAVGRGDITQVVTATGTLNPVTNVTVGCQVSGQISKLFADYNSPVTNGQLIAQINPRTYQAQVEQASADVASAKANLELQQVETARDAQLFTNKLISGSDYDTAVATLHEAAATVQIKQAALDTAKANLGFCDIYSPVDGMVISRNVDVGQTVAASLQSPTLFQIANSLKEMQIDANVDEADIGGVKEGQGVDFTVDAYPNRTFHGIVTQVRNAPTTVNNVVTYDTVISVTNSDYSLKPGMTASVSVVVAQHNDVLEIPNSALRFQPVDMATIETNAPTTAGVQNTNNNNGERAGNRGGRRGGRGTRRPGEHSVVHTVYVLGNNATDKNDKLKAMQVKIGITDNIDTEVLSGLKEGDSVVTGLAIPGLASGQETQNPFAMRRRF